MIKKPTSILALLLVVHILAGCTTVGANHSASAQESMHDNMDGTLWIQSSPEYAAVTRGIYALANTRLKEITPPEEKPEHGLAIVLDLDETVIDNSRYQAQLIKDKASYGSESWDRWIALRKASAVPGAVEFIRAGNELGFHIVFVTNRACRTRTGTTEYCPQKQDTLANLEAIGIDTKLTTLYLRGERPPKRCETLLSAPERADGLWSSDKTSRRNCVKLDHNIAMLFGDQMGDFEEIEDRSSFGSGQKLASRFDEKWGKSWFMLPNPTYGDWKPRTTAEKQLQIRGID